MGIVSFSACLESLQQQKNLPESLRNIDTVSALREKIAGHLEENPNDFESMFARTGQ